MACDVMFDDCDEKAVVQFCKDCYSGKMDNVQRALESGIDPNSQTHVMGDYPLHRACLGLQDNPNVTNELVCWGARVDSVVRNDGNTPLHYAATNNNKKCVEILTKHRCKTDIKNKAGKTPIQEAEEKNHKDIVKLLKTVTKSQTDPEPFSLPTYRSIKQLCQLKLGDDNWIRLGIALGLEKDRLEEMRSSTQSQKLMFLEAKKKSNFVYHDVVKALIKIELWDVVEEIRQEHWDEYSSVSMSAYFGSVKYFEYLVAKEQCDPKAKLIDVKGQSMLTHTCIGGHLEFIVNLIEKHGFSPDEPLNDAADTLSALSAKNGALRDYFHSLQQKDGVDKATVLHHTSSSAQASDEASSSKDVNNIEPFESTADTENEPIPKNASQQTSSETDCATCLRKLRDTLWDVRADWNNLAIELDIPLGTRKAIRVDNRDLGVGKMFTAMLEEWLNGPIDLDDLMTALRSKPVGRGDMAEILQKKITSGEIKQPQ